MYLPLNNFNKKSQFKELAPNTGVDIASPADLVNMIAHLTKMGYGVVNHKAGAVKGCAELTFMRVHCPMNRGVYSIGNAADAVA